MVDKKTGAIQWLSRQEIEQKARDILRQHGLETIPINPVSLANQLGIQVNNAKFNNDTIAAMIAKRGDNLMLLVNQDDPPYRKRFSIAHELGHHFLHLISDGEFVDKESDLFRGVEFEDSKAFLDRDRQEVQANIFAAALLMPEDMVREEFKNVSSVDELAIKFGVSSQAMAIRLTILGLI